MPQTARVRHVDFVSFIAKLIFAISIILAIAAVGYKFYLGYSIKAMGEELETLRAEISAGAVDELVDLNSRIVSTEALLKSHRTLSPVFAWLETATPKTVRFAEFNYSTGKTGPELSVRGEAKSYAALAFAANTIYQNENFKNPAFSDIRLDEKGNVTFSLRMTISPQFLSYERNLSKVGATATTSSAVRLNVATSTATSTGAVKTTATSTAKTATSTPN